MTANIAASIRQRLLNISKQEGGPFDEILKRYGIERLLYRLSISEAAHQFVLKGAQLLRAWQLTSFRPTQDVDFLGFTENTAENLIHIVRQFCEYSTESEDGLHFFAESVEAERIKEDADYEGVRLRVKCALGSARIALQMDVGFDDVITPESIDVTFPVLLDQPAPKLRGYPPETVIAEKLEAMVSLGERNSRMKDFYDLRYLTRTQSFHIATLRAAVENTFARRGTALPTALPVLLREENPVSEQKQTQWKAFMRKNRMGDSSVSFINVARELRPFVEAFLLIEVKVNTQTWTPNIGWECI